MVAADILFRGIVAPYGSRSRWFLADFCQENSPLVPAASVLGGIIFNKLTQHWPVFLNVFSRQHSINSIFRFLTHVIFHSFTKNTSVLIVDLEDLYPSPMDDSRSLTSHPGWDWAKSLKVISKFLWGFMVQNNI